MKNPQKSVIFKVFLHFGSGLRQPRDVYPQTNKIPSENPMRIVKIKKNNSIQQPLFRRVYQIFQKGTRPFQKGRSRILHRRCPKSGKEHGTKYRIQLPRRSKIPVEKQRERPGNAAAGALKPHPSRGAAEPPVCHRLIGKEKKSQKKKGVAPDTDPSE